MKYIKNLDSLRAIAAIAVLAFHYGLLPCGWIGVQVFFVLSAYLISSILLRKMESRPRFLEYISTFFRRRALRLVPLYLFYTLFITLVFSITARPASFIDAAPYLYTYSLNFARMLPGYNNSAIYSHFWSLGAEWQFYLFWPVFLYFTSKRYLGKILVAFIFIAPAFRLLSSYLVLQLDWPGAPDLDQIGDFIYNAPWTYLDAFALGALLCHPRAVALFAGRRFCAGITLAFLFSGLYVYILANGIYPLSMRSLGWPLNMPVGMQSIWGYSLLSFATASIIALVLAGNPKTDRLLNHGILHYLGKISYGIYVWHAPIVWAAWRFLLKGEAWYSLKSLALFPVVLAATITAAHYSYKLLEARFLAQKNNPESNLAPPLTTRLVTPHSPQPHQAGSR